MKTTKRTMGKLSNQEKLYRVLGELNDHQIKNFYLSYFGKDYLFEMISDSVQDDNDLKRAVKLVKSIK